MTAKEPHSNRDWFVIAIPTGECLDIADAYEDNRDEFLSELSEMARDHYEWFHPELGEP